MEETWIENNRNVWLIEWQGVEQLEQNKINKQTNKRTNKRERIHERIEGGKKWNRFLKTKKFNERWKTLTKA